MLHVAVVVTGEPSAAPIRPRRAQAMLTWPVSRVGKSHSDARLRRMGRSDHAAAWLSVQLVTVFQSRSKRVVWAVLMGWVSELCIHVGLCGYIV